MPPAARLKGLGTTIFTEMTALAVRTGAINLIDALLGRNVSLGLLHLISPR